MDKIIECKRSFKVTDLCQICFNTSQVANIYELNLGFNNGHSETKQTMKVCSRCIEDLKQKLNKVV